MQCYRLVGKGEFSASIGTAGDCCAVSGGQVEVRSRRQEPQWRNFAGRWTRVSDRETNRSLQPADPYYIRTCLTSRGPQAHTPRYSRMEQEAQLLL